MLNYVQQEQASWFSDCAKPKLLKAPYNDHSCAAWNSPLQHILERRHLLEFLIWYYVFLMVFMLFLSFQRTIVLSVLLRITASDKSFDIFKLFLQQNVSILFSDLGQQLEWNH